MILERKETITMTEGINETSVYQFTEGLARAVGQFVGLMSDGIVALAEELEEMFVNAPENWTNYDEDFDNFYGKDFAIDLIGGDKVIITQFF